MSDGKPLNSLQPNVQRSWMQVGVAPIRRRNDMALAQEVWEVDVIGIRSDGNTFTITITLLPEKMTAPGPEIAQGFHMNLMIAFGKLESYRNCDCRHNPPLTCKGHAQPEEKSKLLTN